MIGWMVGLSFLCGAAYFLGSYTTLPLPRMEESPLDGAFTVKTSIAYAACLLFEFIYVVSSGVDTFLWITKVCVNQVQDRAKRLYMLAVVLSQPTVEPKVVPVVATNDRSGGRKAMAPPSL